VGAAELSDAAREFDEFEIDQRLAVIKHNSTSHSREIFILFDIFVLSTLSRVACGHTEYFNLWNGLK